jgi:hypothetical protein
VHELNGLQLHKLELPCSRERYLSACHRRESSTGKCSPNQVHCRQRFGVPLHSALLHGEVNHWPDNEVSMSVSLPTTPS